MPRRIATRLAVVFGGLTVVLTIVLLAVVPALARDATRADLERELRAEARLAASLAVLALDASGCPTLDECPPNRLDPAALARRIGEASGSRVGLLTREGRLLAEWPPPAAGGTSLDPPGAREALAAGDGAARFATADDGPLLVVAAPLGGSTLSRGAVRLGLPLVVAEALPERLGRALLLVGAGATLLVALTALVVARSVSAPLDALRERLLLVADDPGATSLPPLPSGVPREVERLALGLDRLLVSLRGQVHQREAERDRLDAALANLADGVVIVDGGRVTRLNPAAEHLLGVPGVLAVGHTVAEVLRDHELVALVESARRAPVDAPPPPRFLEGRASRRFLRAAVARLPANGDRQVLLVLQDLTELRRLESVRRDFVANVSHDLRTPIAAIRAMVETLQDGAVDDPDAARDFLARIHDEVQGLHRLVEELLELSRLEAGRAELELAPTDIRALVDSVVRRLAPLAERAGLALRAELPDALPPVQADAERLTQVLVSVVHNAIKFTPPGGAIVVSAVAEDDQLRLAVRDTGAGLTPEQLDRIFERFYKADQARAAGGTGLGLAIAKHTVQLHGGRIWAESDGPDRGTTVQITLPRAA